MSVIQFVSVVPCCSGLPRAFAGVKRIAYACACAIICCATLLLAPVGVALGQDRPPQSQDIIDALKPANPPTRTRNLIINKAPAADQAASPAPQDPPSASTPANLATPSADAPAREPAKQGKPSISLAISFALNSYTLTNEGRQLADTLGQALSAPALSEYHFIVEGHTDSTGSPVINQSLSQSRAEAVRNHLIAFHHISPDRLRAIGKGSSDPADASNPRAAQNRRVRVLLADD